MVIIIENISEKVAKFLKPVIINSEKNDDGTLTIEISSEDIAIRTISEINMIVIELDTIEVKLASNQFNRIVLV